MKFLKIIAPIMITTIIAAFMLAYPYLMAFVFELDGWKQVGWATYFLIVPLDVVLVIAGLVSTMIEVSISSKGESAKRNNLAWLPFLGTLTVTIIAVISIFSEVGGEDVFSTLPLVIPGGAIVLTVGYIGTQLVTMVQSGSSKASKADAIEET